MHFETFQKQDRNDRTLGGDNYYNTILQNRQMYVYTELLQAIKDTLSLMLPTW